MSASSDFNNCQCEEHKLLREITQAQKEIDALEMKQSILYDAIQEKTEKLLKMIRTH